MKDFMQDFNAFSTSDFQKLLEQNNIQTVDWAALLDMGRKNAQLLATIQQLGLEAWQDMINTSQKVAQELASEQAQLASSAIAEGPPEQKIAKATESLRVSYEKTHNRYKEISEIQHKLSQDLSELISRRIKANLKEMQESVSKK